jgi:hypothetical protein
MPSSSPNSWAFPTARTCRFGHSTSAARSASISPGVSGRGGLILGGRSGRGARRTAHGPDGATGSGAPALAGAPARARGGATGLGGGADGHGRGPARATARHRAAADRPTAQGARSAAPADRRLRRRHHHPRREAPAIDRKAGTGSPASAPGRTSPRSSRTRAAGGRCFPATPPARPRPPSPSAPTKTRATNPHAQ